MTPQDMAERGLRMLKQAVIAFLEQHADGAARPREIREALSLLDENSKGQRKGYLLWGLKNMLEQEGEIEKGKDADGRNILIRTR